MSTRLLSLIALGVVACGNDPGGTAIDAATDTDADSDGRPPIDGADGPTGPDADPGMPSGLVVFDPDVLHTLELTVDAQYLAQLDDNQNEIRVPATIVFDGITVTNTGLRKKGATSLRPLSDKPGFTIKFNSFVPGQQLDGLKKLTIDNAVQDPGLLTGHLSYEVYRRAGLPAPRTSHATVRFNGVDKGIYVLEESTNAEYLADHFGDGSGNLYEGPWDFPHGVDRADLKDEVEEMRNRDDLTALHAVVMNAPAAELATQLAVHLDVNQFIDNYAVEMVAALWDNYALVAWNYYLYHVPGGRFVILTHGVNWPYWHADMDPFDIHTDPWNADAPPGFLCDRINQVPALDAQRRAAVTRVARDAFDVTALIARIDRAAAMMHSRAVTGNSAGDRAAFDARVEEARAFVRERKAYLVTRLGL